MIFALTDGYSPGPEILIIFLPFILGFFAVFAFSIFAVYKILSVNHVRSSETELDDVRYKSRNSRITKILLLLGILYLLKLWYERKSEDGQDFFFPPNVIPYLKGEWSSLHHALILLILAGVISIFVGSERFDKRSVKKKKGLVSKIISYLLIAIFLLILVFFTGLTSS